MTHTPGAAATRPPPVGNYANVVDRGQKDVMQNSDTLRIRLAGHPYELRLNGGAEVRVGFLEVAP